MAIVSVAFRVTVSVAADDGHASRHAAPGPPPACALLQCMTETVTGAHRAATGLLPQVRFRPSPAVSSGRRDPGTPVPVAPEAGWNLTRNAK
jgi:hypothetical protein